jgi:serine/threonine-protein kinase
MHDVSFSEDQTHWNGLAPSSTSSWHKWLGCALGTGAYRIVEHLGSGGMGHVFRAESKDCAQVAVKLLSDEAGSELQRLFADETVLLFGQTHPNIVRAIEAGAMDRTPYLMMEYLPGPNLADWLVYNELRSPSRVLKILAQVASAIQHLHTQGIVHRDIKPANLMLDESDDTVKLIDFGIAVRENSRHRGDNQQLIGTPAYMAPELAAGEPCTRPSDVYALGALALELLTGVPPHGAAPVMAILDALLHGSPTLPSARGLFLPGLDAFFKRALSRNPAKRFQTPQELVGALGEVLHPLRSAPAEHLPRRLQRRRSVVVPDKVAGCCP